MYRQRIQPTLPCGRMAIRVAFNLRCFIEMMKFCVSLAILLPRALVESATLYPRKAWSIIAVSKLSLPARGHLFIVMLPDKNVTWPARQSRRCGTKGVPELELGQALLEIRLTDPSDGWVAGNLSSHFQGGQDQCFLEKDDNNVSSELLGTLMRVTNNGFPPWFIFSSLTFHYPLCCENRFAPHSMCTNINTCSDAWWHSSKHCWTGKSLILTTRKLCFKGKKVVGTIEGHHYDQSILEAKTQEERQGHSAPPSKELTVGSKNCKVLGTPMSMVSDKVDKLACAVKSLDKKWVGLQLVIRLNLRNLLCHDCSSSGSSMHLCGSNQFGTHSGCRKCWLSWSTALEGHNSVGLVLWRMLVCKTLVGVMEKCA